MKKTGKARTKTVFALGVQEASGVAAVGNSTFLVVDDEHGIFRCVAGHAPRQLDAGKGLADLEGIAVTADGSRTAVGTTATLELTPEQTKIITVAQQMADRLTLALRSVADVQESDSDGAKYLLSGEDGSAAIQLIRSGSITKVGATN